MKRKGQHARWVEEVGILGSSPDTKLKKKNTTILRIHISYRISCGHNTTIKNCSCV